MYIPLVFALSRVSCPLLSSTYFQCTIEDGELIKVQLSDFGDSRQLHYRLDEGGKEEMSKEMTCNFALTPSPYFLSVFSYFLSKYTYSGKWSSGFSF
jgi:hypothetical protein